MRPDDPRSVLPLPPLVAAPTRQVSGLSPLEIAYGLAFGANTTAASSSRLDHVDVAEALDAVIGAALQRPPCLVSFSGGRDSSALLAWAARLARREGLEPPVPATLVIPGDSDADESDWQRIVLDHLGLEQHIRFTVGTELDCAGPVATAMLRRHGVLFPFNTHMHVPIFAAASGGSVITGFGGDELGRSSEVAVHAAQLLTGRRRFGRTAPLEVGLAVAPQPVRRAVFTRRASGTLADLPWLRPGTRRRLAAALGRDDAAVPISWAKIVTDWWDHQRYFSGVVESFATAAQPWNVMVRHPFADASFRAALSRVGGFAGLGTRGHLMTTVFGEVLPESILFRQSKASFSNVLFTSVAREFGAAWSGEGLDDQLVDPAVLRRIWTSPEPADMRSMALLQTAWLHDHQRL